MAVLGSRGIVVKFTTAILFPARQIVTVQAMAGQIATDTIFVYLASSKDSYDGASFCIRSAHIGMVRFLFDGT